MPRLPIFLLPDGQSLRAPQPPRIDLRREDPSDGEMFGLATLDAENSAVDELQVLQAVCDWLEDAIGAASQCRDKAALLHHTRDRALLLMLFWRRIGVAELLALQVENVHIAALAGASCDFMRCQRRRRINWLPIATPALKPLCPVSALQLWLSVSGLRCGPLFPRIKHGGDLAPDALPPDGVLPLLLGLVALSHDEDTGAAT